MCGSSETPATIFTQMWVFACMYNSMSLKVTKLCETLPTLVTLMWTFSCVCPVVHQRIEIVTKTSVAHLTVIQAISGSTVRSISENWFEVWAGKRRGWTQSVVSFNAISINSLKYTHWHCMRLKCRNIILSDNSHHYLTQTTVCGSRQSCTHCYSNVLWALVHMFQFNIMQLILGFYSPCLKKVLYISTFSSQTCDISN